MWSRRKRGKRSRTDGFVLVEVLVTAAVAAVLLAALMRAFSSVWGGIGAVREEAEAMLVARAVIDASTPRVNMAPLAQEGMSGRYAWSVSVINTGIQSATTEQTQRQPASLVSAPGQPTTRQTDSEEPREGGQQEESREVPWTLFRIAVAVRAPSGRRTTVETFRLSRPAAR
jgi:hypothetical protein